LTFFVNFFCYGRPSGLHEGASRFFCLGSWRTPLLFTFLQELFPTDLGSVFAPLCPEPPIGGFFFFGVGMLFGCPCHLPVRVRVRGMAFFSPLFSKPTSALREPPLSYSGSCPNVSLPLPLSRPFTDQHDKSTQIPRRSFGPGPFPVFPPTSQCHSFILFFGTFLFPPLLKTVHFPLYQVDVFPFRPAARISLPFSSFPDGGSSRKRLLVQARAPPLLQ